jgi:hypothetical protein
VTSYPFFVDAGGSEPCIFENPFAFAERRPDDGGARRPSHDGPPATR